MNRWDDLGRDAGQYAAAFAALAAAGRDVHGEASFCAALVPPPARILDAGCGTGRVAIRLAELGYECVGIDADEAMLRVARSASSPVRWIHADLTRLPETGRFDLVVAAGNVMPLLAPGTEAGVIADLTGRLRPGGLLVAGFGLDAAHLPLDEAPFGLDQYDDWCLSAGLTLVNHHATWQGAEYRGGGYVVAVHRRPASSADVGPPAGPPSPPDR